MCIHSHDSFTCMYLMFDYMYKLCCAEFPSIRNVMLAIAYCVPFCVQVNLEYLGRVVFNSGDMLCPDSVVGTDSHTTMINGLGIVGWGTCNF